MKSAYELAMERLNKDNPMAQLTAEQKDQISELDSKYAAKIAEKEIFLNGEIEKALQAGEIEVYESLKTQLTTEKKSAARGAGGEKRSGSKRLISSKLTPQIKARGPTARAWQ